MLEEERLDRRRHRCADFDCGNEALNNYLRQKSTQDRRRNLSQIYVLVDSAEPSHILGYYTLSAAEVETGQLTVEEKRRLPCYPIPCFRMGRLAVHSANQGQGIGKILLGCAVDRCLEARKSVAAYALIVDAKDEKAKAFYQHFGFVPFADQTESLYLALGKCLEFRAGVKIR